MLDDDFFDVDIEELLNASEFGNIIAAEATGK